MRKLFGSDWVPSVLCVVSLLMFTLAATGVNTWVSPQLAFAQDEEEEEFEDEEEFEEVEDVADLGGSTAGGASPSTGDGESILSWAFEAMGWSYSLVFLAISFTLVALFVMNILQARRENVVPTSLIEGFEGCLNDKKYQEAYEMAKNDSSFLGKVLSSGLAKLKDGYEPAIEAMQEVGEEENMKMEHRLSYMALIGTISPMIGLFGTVHGMITAFQVIASATTAPKPADLAKGISTALFTTLVGLFIAIPAISAYNILRNRVARLVLEIGIISEGLMSRFQNVGRGTGGGEQK